MFVVSLLGINWKCFLYLIFYSKKMPPIKLFIVNKTCCEHDIHYPSLFSPNLWKSGAPREFLANQKVFLCWRRLVSHWKQLRCMSTYSLTTGISDSKCLHISSFWFDYQPNFMMFHCLKLIWLNIVAHMDHRRWFGSDLVFHQLQMEIISGFVCESTVHVMLRLLNLSSELKESESF